MRRFLVAAIAALLLASGVTGCAGTQELPLAPNMVRLDVNGWGTFFVGEATLRRAAEVTLENGYSAFRLTPLYAQTPFEFGVTVVMFHAGDPGARGAFDAAEVLRRHAL